MNMAAKYRTRQGDMLDRICIEYYGYSSEAVEAVLKQVDVDISIVKAKL